MSNGEFWTQIEANGSLRALLLHQSDQKMFFFSIELFNRRSKSKALVSDDSNVLNVVAGIFGGPMGQCRVTCSIGSLHKLRHKRYVCNSQSQSLYSWQPFFVGESGYLFPQFIKCFVQVVHPSPFSDISCPSLGHTGHPSACLVLGRFCRLSIGQWWRIEVGAETGVMMVMVWAIVWGDLVVVMMVMKGWVRGYCMMAARTSRRPAGCFPQTLGALSDAVQKPWVWRSVIDKLYISEAPIMRRIFISSSYNILNYCVITINFKSISPFTNCEVFFAW